MDTLFFLSVWFLLLWNAAAAAAVRDVNGVTLAEKMEGMDKVLVESQVPGLVSPCSVYSSGRATLGEQTSAQWMRVAFHDVITADVQQGIGFVTPSNTHSPHVLMRACV
jgi:hypothetical protein